MRKTGKQKAVLALLLASALLVSACGTGSGESGANGSPDGGAAEQPADGGLPDETGKRDGNGGGPALPGSGDGAEGETGGDSDTIAAQPATDEPPVPTMEVEVEVEGVKETRTGTLAVTDNGYHLYVIPPFVFTAEEPGADLVYMEAYPDYAMRIQAYPGDTDVTRLRETAEAELAADGGSFEEWKDDAIHDPDLRDAHAYLQSADDEMVKKIIIMSIDGLVFRFTMFLPVGGEASEGAESGFNAMIKTIRAN